MLCATFLQKRDIGGICCLFQSNMLHQCPLFLVAMCCVLSFVAFKMLAYFVLFQYCVVGVASKKCQLLYYLHNFVSCELLFRWWEWLLCHTLAQLHTQTKKKEG